jgi:hydroxypyruvate isomerase
MITRRKAIKNAAMGAGAIGLGLLSCDTADGKTPVAEQQNEKSMGTAKFKHSVCRWCYNGIPLEELCEKSVDLGIKSIEIIGPDDWKIVQKYGLTCGMGNAPFINLSDGMNNPKNHKPLLEGYTGLFKTAADMGIQNIICFSGNRNGLDDETGLENCATCIDPIVKEAEKHGIMLCMELLNSKVNHKDYQCDKTPWGVQLVEKVGSPNFKLLYDIYHMQIMEGDVIATIRKYKDHIAHYHTGGVPGRNEINETQELYYPAIMKAIVDIGYEGFVGQEFVPTWDDKLAALAEGVKICSV